jgi:hypothetical protein
VQTETKPSAQCVAPPSQARARGVSDSVCSSLDLLGRAWSNTQTCASACILTLFVCDTHTLAQLDHDIHRQCRRAIHRWLITARRWQLACSDRARSAKAKQTACSARFVQAENKQPIALLGREYRERERTSRDRGNTRSRRAPSGGAAQFAQFVCRPAYIKGYLKTAFQYYGQYNLYLRINLSNIV